MDVSASWTHFLATAVSLSTYSSIHLSFYLLLKKSISCLCLAKSFISNCKLRDAPNARTLSAAKRLFASFSWRRWHVQCFVDLPYLPAGSGQNWPLYVALTLMLGQMLGIARYRPHGCKLSILCQGLYICLTWTKQNLHYHRYFFGYSNANFLSWLHGYFVFYIRLKWCVERNVTRHPFRWRICFLYWSTIRFQLLFTPMYPGKEQTTSDRLTANCGTIGIPWNLQLHAARFILSRKCKLTVIHSIVTCSVWYITQEFPIFVFIFLAISTTASCGSTNTSDQCDWVSIKLNNGHFIEFGPGWDTAAMQTPVCPPWCCNCSHRQYNLGQTFQTSM